MSVVGWIDRVVWSRCAAGCGEPASDGSPFCGEVCQRQWHTQRVAPVPATAGFEITGRTVVWDLAGRELFLSEHGQAPPGILADNARHTRNAYRSQPAAPTV